METILAFSVMRAGPLPVQPRDGGCACALAFSTLLSSQGADAHHRRSLDLVRGNPANLPGLPGRVNLLRKTGLAWSRGVDQAYPRLADPIPGFARWEGTCSIPGEPPPCGLVRPTGATRNCRQLRGCSQIARPAWRRRIPPRAPGRPGPQRSFGRAADAARAGREHGPARAAFCLISAASAASSSASARPLVRRGTPGTPYKPMRRLPVGMMRITCNPPLSGKAGHAARAAWPSRAGPYAALRRTHAAAEISGAACRARFGQTDEM
jgi:hypothetical protein